MAEEKMIRLGQASRKLNVGHNTILEFLAKKGFVVENNPNAKLSPEQFAMLSKEYASSASEKIEASSLTIGAKHNENIAAEAEVETVRKKAHDDDQIMIKNLGSNPAVKEKPKEEPKPEKVDREAPKLDGIKVLGKIDLTPPKKTKAEPVVEPKAEVKVEPPVKEKAKVEEKPAEVIPEKPEQELIKARADKLQGLKVVDKIELPADKKKDKPVASSDANDDSRKKRPRKRLPSQDDRRGPSPGAGTGTQAPRPARGGVGRPMPARAPKAEPTEKEIQEQIRATLAKLSGNTKKQGGAKYRREKRQAYSEAEEEKILQEQEASKTLKVTEFISANDLASLMDVSVNDVISTCLSLGMFVSINQRLDAEAITVIADEFGYEVQFTTNEEEEEVEENDDVEEDLKPRAPIVTI